MKSSAMHLQELRQLPRSKSIQTQDQHLSLEITNHRQELLFIVRSHPVVFIRLYLRLTMALLVYQMCQEDRVRINHKHRRYLSTTTTTLRR
ncbi:hypothetical protein OSTOST_00723 [Ostertagia ostertagi]